MSVKVMSLVWECRALSNGWLLAMLALADFASDSGSNIYPSVATLSVKLRISERQTQRMLRDMEAAGWISCVDNSLGGRGNSRHYAINLDKLKSSEDVVLKGDTDVTLSASKSETERVTPRAKNGGVDVNLLRSERVTSETSKGDTDVTLYEQAPKTQRVTSGALKGDTAMSEKGDTAVSPDTSGPVRTISSNTTLGMLPNSVCGPETKPTKPNSYLEQATEVLMFLNEKTGRNYRAVDGNGKATVNLHLIVDRLKSGVSVQDCKTMIARKYREWAGDDKSWPWLRPSTLFRASNFEQYLGECTTTEKRGARV